MINDNLILLKGGSFMMGSPENEVQRDKDEVLHEVIINPFYISPYEVTQKEYQAVMGENPSATGVSYVQTVPTQQKQRRGQRQGPPASP